jgi:hypothetical protein
MRADLRRLERAIDLAIERLDHRGRRARAHHDPEESDAFVVEHALLGQRRHVGQLRHARGSGDGERAQLAGAHVLQRARDVGRQQIHVVAQEPDHRGPEAAERHMRHLDSHLLREFLHGKMGKRAAAGRAVAHLVRMRLGVADELGDRPRRQRRIDDHHRRYRDQQRDGHEIALGVVGRPLAERGIGGDVGAGLQQRVAVGRCLDDRAGTDDRGGARLVLHQHRLGELLRELVGQEPRHRVGVPSRREGHDDMDRPRRIGLARRERRLQQRRAGNEKRQKKSRHVSSGAHIACGSST